MHKVQLKDSEKVILSELYKSTTRTVDDLPYTDEFEKLYVSFVARSGSELSRHDFWRALSSARKARKLVRKER